MPPLHGIRGAPPSPPSAFARGDLAQYTQSLGWGGCFPDSMSLSPRTSRAGHSEGLEPARGEGMARVVGECAQPIVGAQ